MTFIADAHEFHLDGAVVLDPAMEIQVIPREIGEGRNVEVDIVGASLGDGMR